MYVCVCVCKRKLKNKFDSLKIYQHKKAQGFQTMILFTVPIIC